MAEHLNIDARVKCIKCCDSKWPRKEASEGENAPSDRFVFWLIVGRQSVPLGTKHTIELLSFSLNPSTSRYVHLCNQLSNGLIADNRPI